MSESGVGSSGAGYYLSSVIARRKESSPSSSRERRQAQRYRARTLSPPVPHQAYIAKAISRAALYEEESSPSSSRERRQGQRYPASHPIVTKGASNRTIFHLHSFTKRLSRRLQFFIRLTAETVTNVRIDEDATS